MKRKLATVLLALLAIAPAVQAQGINMFDGTWSQVLAEAKRTGKPIYLDAYASWCGPCKLLKRETFPREDVGAYFNANYISYSLDMEKGEGIELAKKYNVRAYPTHLWFDSDGNIVHRTVGGGAGDDFAKNFIQDAKDARDPNKQLYTAKRRFEKGERDKEMLYNLALGSYSASMEEAEYFALEYIRSLNDADLADAKHWKAIRTITDDYEDPGFGLVMRNREMLVKAHGRAEVETVALAAAANQMARVERMTKYSTSLFKQGDSVFATATKPEEVRALGRMILAFHQSSNDWTSYASAAVRYVEVGGVDDASELNEIAWTFYEKVDDNAMLAKAVKWAETALGKNDNYAIADTYAAVLFKLGRKGEAEKAAQHAIELGRKEGADFAATEELLGKIKAL
jgi:thioredoxin-related protein